MAEKKKIKVKLKKKEEEVEKAPAVPTEGKEIFELLSKIGKRFDKIESLKGVDLEIEEMTLEGVIPPYELLARILSGASAEAAPPAVPTPVPPPAPPVIPKLEEFKFEAPVDTYKGKFEVVKIGATKEEGGTRAFTLTIGGNPVPPFYKFEGDLPYRPVIAHCVFDEDIKLPKALRKYYEDVIGDPVKWARKCIEEYGAKMIWLDLNSTDPRGTNRSAEEAARTVKEVLNAIDVPMGISVRSGDMKKDTEVMKKCAEAAKGENLILFNGSITLPALLAYGLSLADEIYEYFKAVKEYGHIVTNYQPMNIPGLAVLNRTAIDEVGIPKNKIVIDPGLVPIGYGTEVSITAMDAICAKAFYGETSYQTPIIGASSNTWMFKESFSEDENMGSIEYRGPALEIGTAMAGLMSGVHFLVMLDQYAIDVVESFLDRIYSKRIEKPEELRNFLPKNDCKNCGYDLCLDFANAVMKGEQKLEKCERLTNSGIRSIKRLLEPPKEIIAEPQEIYDWIKQI